MSLFTGKRIYFSLISILIVVLTGIVIWYGIDTLVEFWWFDSLGYSFYFILRESYWLLITVGTTLLIAGLIYANFWLLSKNLGYKLSGVIGITVSMVLAIPVLIPVYINWKSVLLFLNAVSSGMADPVFSKDISFYLFQYPVYQLIMLELLTVFILLFLIIALLYWRDQEKLQEVKNSLPVNARAHLLMLFLIVAGLIAWKIILQRYDMLFETNHEPVFMGPGAVEMQYKLPLIWIAWIGFVAATGVVAYSVYRKLAWKWLLGFVGLFLFALGLGEIDFFPKMINRFYVSANPVNAERDYISNHIQATLHAFDLDRVEKRLYPAVSSLTPEISAEIREDLMDIPLWDNHLLQEVFQQLQTIRPYYEFSSLSVDRYILANREYQVNIGAREISVNKLPESAKNWQNRHLIYTHGYGVAMMSSTQVGEQPIKWLVSGITSKAEYKELNLQHPEIYYGLGQYDYAIVPNTAATTVVSGEGKHNDYAGTGGIKMSSYISKALLAFYLKDQNVFFSTHITGQSRLLLKRNIHQRIRTIAPFIQLDDEPYPVIANGKLYWIVDAYTVSDRYPLVRPVASPFRHSEKSNVLEEFNYIRNSIKIIVDAYNGSVDFYIVDDTDPIAATLHNIFPMLFQSESKMPKALIRHLSYPKALFTLQMQIYSRYHQTDPGVFYQQSEALEFAKTDNKPVLPYFLSIKPEGNKSGQQGNFRQKFLIVSPMSPVGQDNLAMIGIAGCLFQAHCEQDYENDILIYTFPRDRLIHGPEQINAMIDQTPEIAGKLTLWNQRGSRVIRGRIITVPVGKSLLYIQPLYLAASAKNRFPQLVRVIVAMNQRVAMDVSLQGAFNKLQAKNNGKQR